MESFVAALCERRKMATVIDRRYKRMIAPPASTFHQRAGAFPKSKTDHNLADLRETRFGRDNLGDFLLPAAI